MLHTCFTYPPSICQGIERDNFTTTFLHLFSKIYSNHALYTFSKHISGSDNIISFYPYPPHIPYSPILALIPLNHIKPDLCSIKFNQVISYSFPLFILYPFWCNMVYSILCHMIVYNVLELYFDRSISFNIIFCHYISPGPLPSTIGLYEYLRRHIGGLWGIYAGIVLGRVYECV